MRLKAGDALLVGAPAGGVDSTLRPLGLLPLGEPRMERRARVVSAASAWEIATKFRIGKLLGCEVVAVDVAGHISGQGFEELAIGVADAERAERLPGPHRDPFDRMLAAQALAHEFPVVSVDPVFDRFGVIRVW